MTKRGFGLLFVAGTSVLLADGRRAEACGGCFIPPAVATVVTDHRVALAISKTQTVLWDQIRYSGNPKEFAWVLPVNAGARIEISNDELFAALDTSTRPVVYPPVRIPEPGCSFGCGGDDSASSSSSSSSAGGSVQVLSQSVVGP